QDELMRLFTEPFRIDGRDVVAEIKSGVACYPQDNIEPHDLVQNAEAALKEAKTSGERYQHHRVEMNAELARRLSMEQRLRVALNVSPPELRRRKIADEILECIGDLAGDPDWGVDLEITEGVLSGDASSCVNALRLLRAAGVRIAIDDFGTGFSSLGRLSELPIDTLKIDRSFTSRLPTDRKSGTLVSTIIALARAFDMTTVAEGVENRAQLD